MLLMMYLRCNTYKNIICMQFLVLGNNMKLICDFQQQCKLFGKMLVKEESQQLKSCMPFFICLLSSATSKSLQCMGRWSLCKAESKTPLFRQKRYLLFSLLRNLQSWLSEDWMSCLNFAYSSVPSFKHFLRQCPYKTFYQYARLVRILAT